MSKVSPADPAPLPGLQPIEQELLFSRLHDAQRIIAAVKVQRWDVLKWVMAVNLALTTAAVAINRGAAIFVALAIFAAAMGIALVWHYNGRATHNRAVLRDCRRIAILHIDDQALASLYVPTTKKSTYDHPELTLFTLCMAASAFLPLAASLSYDQ